ncbi:putative thioesterase family protein [Zalerion maritima]|uniref:Thioesterase family protein n=1 Tax=Zalerion maritima TaxID=339359 RepID=A0AAD5RS26_9PEZI|nr:putative thioesterase family protein [Zalerion maritima]
MASPASARQEPPLSSSSVSFPPSQSVVRKTSTRWNEFKTREEVEIEKEVARIQTEKLKKNDGGGGEEQRRQTKSGSKTFFTAKELAALEERRATGSTKRLAVKKQALQGVAAASQEQKEIEATTLATMGSEMKWAMSTGVDFKEKRKQAVRAGIERVREEGERRQEEIERKLRAVKAIGVRPRSLRKISWNVRGVVPNAGPGRTGRQSRFIKKNPREVSVRRIGGGISSDRAGATAGVVGVGDGLVEMIRRRRADRFRHLIDEAKPTYSKHDGQNPALVARPSRARTMQDATESVRRVGSGLKDNVGPHNGFGSGNKVLEDETGERDAKARSGFAEWGRSETVVRKYQASNPMKNGGFYRAMTPEEQVKHDEEEEINRRFYEETSKYKQERNAAMEAEAMKKKREDEPMKSMDETMEWLKKAFKEYSQNEEEQRGGRGALATFRPKQAPPIAGKNPMLWRRRYTEWGGTVPRRSKDGIRERNMEARMLRPFATSAFGGRRQQESTGKSGASTAEGVVSEMPSSSATPPKQKTSRTVKILGAFCLILGMGLGFNFRLLLKPPKPPAVGSAEDVATIEIINADAAKLPIVQSLTYDPEWVSWDAYGGIDASHRPNRITTGPLAGSKGVGAYQRVWRKESTGEVIVVLWFGSATTGWPGVVHGGMLATIMDECLGRTAIRCFEDGTGVTARLEMRYRAPVGSNGWVVVRCVPELEGGEGHAIKGSGEGGKKGVHVSEVGKTGESRRWFGSWGNKEKEKNVEEGSKPRNRRKMWVEGRMETLDGKVCVESRGLFVVPKGFRLKRLQEDF